MSEAVEQTNYLTNEMFHKFIETIPKLEVFHGPFAANAALTPLGFKLLFSITYYCALRISETLDLVKDDFNLERKILRVRRAKTGVNQKTSIPIPLLSILTDHWNSIPEKLFEISRQSAWSYAKKVGELAGLNIFESQKKRDIEGIWTHLFRKSYAKMMQEKGADISLIKVKLRHSGGEMGSTFTYIKPDINALIKWETDNIHG